MMLQNVQKEQMKRLWTIIGVKEMTLKVYVAKVKGDLVGDLEDAVKQP